MHLLLIRHGETDWNYEQRIQGHADTPLNANGIAQAERLAARLAEEEHLDVLYTSPLARARVTADIIAQKCGLTPIVDDRLKEKHLGDLEGLSLSDVEQQYPDLYRAWRASQVHFAMPGEESPAELRQRVKAFLDDVQARHNGARVAVVAHGGTIAMLLATLIGLDLDARLPFWFDNASISRVDLSGSRPRIRLLNDTCHLRNGHAS